MNKTGRSQRRSQKGHAIVEFALSIFVVFLVVFVAINLIMVTASIAGAYFITTYSAIQASTQTTYDRALAASTSNCTQLMNSGFASWVKMKPVGGFANSGMNLFVEQRNQDTSLAQTVGPNTPVPAPIDTAKNVYEYMTDCAFEVGPFVNMASFPGLNQIPFVGKAARFHLTASRAVEHPEGLSGYGTLTSLAKAFNGLPKGFVIDANGDAHWINPGESTTKPGTGVSYVLVNDPNGTGAYLLEVSLDHIAHQQMSGQNLDFTIEFHGIHLTPSVNGMVNQLESFTAQDASGHATSYTVDPGQMISISNHITSGWGNHYQGSNSVVAVQEMVQTLGYTQGAGFLPAVEAGWTHFSNWYSQLPSSGEASATNASMYTTGATGVMISSAGTISDTPTPTVSGMSTEHSSVYGVLNNNTLNTNYGTPTDVSGSVQEGADPARFSGGRP